MRLRAHAKLNLSLRVRGVRADGFHQIESLVQTIDLSDEIELRLEGSRLEVDNDLGVPVEEDLAARAAARLLSEKRTNSGVRISIRKGIPAGAGLGGGSSDAAAVLWGLDRLTSPALPEQRLAELAAQLGSDVPLFLTGGRLRITGRGEGVARCRSADDMHFVVLLPPVACDTRAVYAAFDRLGSGERDAALEPGENDLTPAALAHYPQLLRYAEAVKELSGVYSGMSGSGAAFYAAFETVGAADRAAERLASGLPEARAVRCEPTHEGYDITDEGER